MQSWRMTCTNPVRGVLLKLQVKQRMVLASAPPMPDAGVGEGGRHDTHTAARERAMNSLMNLVDGTHEINDRILTFA